MSLKLPSYRRVQAQEHKKSKTQHQHKMAENTANVCISGVSQCRPQKAVVPLLDTC